LELRGGFARVQTRFGTKGWIPSDVLAECPPAASWPEPESEPPPPQPSLPARPPSPPPCPPLRELPGSWLELGLAAKGSAEEPTARHCVKSPPRVELVTFGLENSDPELTERCRQLVGGGASACPCKGDIRAALLRRSVSSDAVLVDARCFPDPESHFFLWHTGRHHEIIARLCRHRNFPSWLAGVKRQFSRAVQADAGGRDQVQNPVTVAVYCRSGKHRSVAAAVILAHILRSQGWACPPLRHLSQPRWGRVCCQGLCEECQEPPAWLQDMLDETLQMWHCIGAAV